MLATVLAERRLSTFLAPLLSLLFRRASFLAEAVPPTLPALTILVAQHRDVVPQATILAGRARGTFLAVAPLPESCGLNWMGDAVATFTIPLYLGHGSLASNARLGRCKRGRRRALRGRRRALLHHGGQRRGCTPGCTFEPGRPHMTLYGIDTTSYDLVRPSYDPICPYTTSYDLVRLPHTNMRPSYDLK